MKFKGLKVGDYTIAVQLPNGEVINFQDKIVIERKADLNELCCNFFDKKDEEGKSCGTLINLTVNALDYTISGESQNNRLVTVGDNMKCELEYPSYHLLKQLKKYDESEMLVRLYSKLIKAIYHGDDVYTNFTDEEIYEWTQDLPHKASKEFEEFLQSLPEIILEYDVKCPKCGTSDHYIVKDILDFFIFDTQART